MEWTDAAIILSVRPHGEKAAVVDVLSASHGRWQGRVNAAQTGPRKAWLAPGTVVEATWRARLEEQLGVFSLEPTQHITAHIFDEPQALLTVDYICQLTRDTTAERLPLPLLFEKLHDALVVLNAANAAWVTIDYERSLLDVLGYGLDISSCAVTGQTHDLTHISPNTGRAVCAAEAEPYKDRLLPLPGYWLDKAATADIAAAAQVTGHFLAQHFYQPPVQLPPVRGQLFAASQSLIGR
ncbi:MAG: DNA repair protein RecO [Bdellovibrionales bacterium]